MSSVKLIAAIDDKLGIAQTKPGTAGIIPWDVPTDRQYFQDMVAEGPVLMGWNTFRANGKRPYGTGKNTVITNQPIDSFPGVEIVHDMEEFFAKNPGDVWVAGGGQVFAQVLPRATHLYLTRIAGDWGCDIFFPHFEDTFRLVEDGPEHVENGVTYRFQLWVSK